MTADVLIEEIVARIQAKKIWLLQLLKQEIIYGTKNLEHITDNWQLDHSADLGLTEGENEKLESLRQGYMIEIINATSTQKP